MLTIAESGHVVEGMTMLTGLLALMLMRTPSLGRVLVHKSCVVPGMSAACGRPSTECFVLAVVVTDLLADVVAAYVFAESPSRIHSQ